MKKIMTKRVLAFALVIMMLVTSCISYTAFADESNPVADGKYFGMDMTAELNAEDSSIIDVVLSIKQVREQLHAVEFLLNFDPTLVEGVVQVSEAPMDVFMTKVPMYTMVVPGTDMEFSMRRYEQISTYEPDNKYYHLRFIDLLQYPNAKDGEEYPGLINDGDLVVTIQFRILDNVAAGTVIPFSTANVKGTTTVGLNSCPGATSETSYTIPGEVEESSAVEEESSVVEEESSAVEEESSVVEEESSAVEEESSAVEEESSAAEDVLVGENLALNKGYTTEGAYFAGKEDDGTLLTDGAYATTETPFETVAFQGTNATNTITVDLGKNAVINKIVVGGVIIAGNRQYGRVTIRVSENGADFTEVTGYAVTEEATDGTAVNFIYDLAEAVTGQYVQISVTQTAYIFALGEIEVYGEVVTEEESSAVEEESSAVEEESSAVEEESSAVEEESSAVEEESSAVEEESSAVEEESSVVEEESSAVEEESSVVEEESSAVEEESSAVEEESSAVEEESSVVEEESSAVEEESSAVEEESSAVEEESSAVEEESSDSGEVEVDENLALNKGYITNGAYFAGKEDDGTLLTDGAYAITETPFETVAFQGSNATNTIVVNLENNAEINKIVVAGVIIAGNRQYGTVTLKVSENGADFTEVTGYTVTEEATEGTAVNFVYTLAEAVKGQYVEITVVQAAYIFALGEIEVYGEVVTEEESSAVEEESSAVEGESSAVEEESSAVEGESSAVEEESSAVEGESSAVEEESSAVEGESSAVEEESSAVEGESSAVEEESSAVEGESSAVEEESSKVEEESSVDPGQTGDAGIVAFVVLAILSLAAIVVSRKARRA